MIINCINSLPRQKMASRTILFCNENTWCTFFLNHNTLRILLDDTINYGFLYWKITKWL